MELTDTNMEQEATQRELKKLVRKQKAKKALLRIIIAAIVLLSTFMAALLYGQNSGKQDAEATIVELTQLLELKDQEIKELNETPIVVSPVTPTINLDIIKSEIQEIGELATAEYLFTNAAKYSDSKQFKEWNIPLTEKSFIVKWDGIIKAGIQVDAVSVDVDEGGMRIVVSLPEAEILSYEVTNTEVVDEKNNILNSISVEDKVKFDEETAEAMKARAIENGLLEKATKNAENLITGILKANAAIGEDYIIEFTEKSA